jgi:hypothetical protein
MLTLSQRRSWARHGDRDIQRTIDAAKAELAADAAVERAAIKAASAEKAKPVPYTTEQLMAATHVRTATGWHKVVRVSAKSVTVETGYSWTDRHSPAKVLQVVKANPPA